MVLDGKTGSESLSDLPKITRVYISQLEPLYTTCHSHSEF